MAPLGIFFGPGSFEGVQVPVFLASAQKDSVLLPVENANVVLDGLGGRLLLVNEIPGAEHGVFLAPCSDELKAHVPLCLDPPGVDRAAIHVQLQSEMVAFFSAALSLRDE
jgi:predicted dienelactone hydrolase